VGRDPPWLDSLRIVFPHLLHDSKHFKIRLRVKREIFLKKKKKEFKMLKGYPMYRRKGL